MLPSRFRRQRRFAQIITRLIVKVNFSAHLTASP
jgi:hypothetical protein